MGEIKRYKLLKDLPHVTKGAIFKPVSALAYAFIQNGMCHVEFAKEVVEQSPEWFEIADFEVKSMIIAGAAPSWDKIGWSWYSFGLNKSMNQKQFPLIKEAIERVLNEESPFLNYNITKQDIDIINEIYERSGKRYTQEDMDEARRRAFNAAREVAHNGDLDEWRKRSAAKYPYAQYPSFDEYSASLNKQ